MTTRHPPQFFISLYGWTYWAPILLAGLFAVILFLLIPGLWWVSILFAILTLACLAFYRDFNRPIPAGPNIMVAPADGKVTEIAHLPHYAPFNGPALKISIFLSVLDVHVNRAPCDGTVLWTRYEEGLFLDARHPECTNKNQSNTIALGTPVPPPTPPRATNHEPRPTNHDAPPPPLPATPTVVLKQIVGAIARRIIAPLTPGETITRGQRIGMIAFGSRTELYVPARDNWQVAVALHAHVKGGRDVLLKRS